MRSNWIVLAVAVIAAAACPKAEVRSRAAAAPSAAGEAAILAAADAADGASDRVVAKCATCRLGMEGDTRYTASYAGYELHFCSPECKQTFESGPGAVIRKLPPPRS